MMQLSSVQQQFETSAKPSLISIRNLSHCFGQGQLKKPVLFDITLDIQAGEIVIMTGPSGSGKTTLLSLIGGLRACQTGSLKIVDQELCGATRSQLVQARRQIGYIFQAHNLLNSLTAQENVEMTLELHPRFLGAIASRKHNKCWRRLD